MAGKMTEKELVKKLDNMEKESLKQFILELYKNNQSAEQAINFVMKGDSYRQDLLEKYKKRLYKIFNPTDIVRMGFSIKDAKNVLDEFTDVCVNDNGRWYGELALYFAECATEFTMCYGDMDDQFYDELGDAYHEVVVIVNDNKELFDLWQERLEKILSEFSGFGWGMEDYIADEYYSIVWIDKETL